MQQWPSSSDYRGPGIDLLANMDGISKHMRLPSTAPSAMNVLGFFMDASIMMWKNSEKLVMKRAALLMKHSGLALKDVWLKVQEAL